MALKLTKTPTLAGEALHILEEVAAPATSAVKPELGDKKHFC